MRSNFYTKIIHAESKSSHLIIKYPIIEACLSPLRFPGGGGLYRENAPSPQGN